MRVLVTGGCGFIGSHIVDGLIEKGHEVIVVDNLSTGTLKNLNSNSKLVQCDIRSEDLFNIFEKFKPEVVYHEAAQIDIQKSIKETKFDADVNVLGTINVLNCCKEAGVKKIIYASSAAVYGNPNYLPVDEKHEKTPISYYGISKFTPENYIKVYSQMYGIKYTILRYANVYGIRQDPKGEGGVVSVFIDKMLKNEQPIIFGDGEQTRDFVYVKDIASANIYVLDKGDNQIFNVSTNKPSSVNLLFELLKEAVNSDIEVKYEEERKGDISHSYLDNSKLKSIGWEPDFSLKDGLQETVEYYKKRYDKMISQRLRVKKTEIIKKLV